MPAGSCVRIMPGGQRHPAVMVVYDELNQDDAGLGVPRVTKAAMEQLHPEVAVSFERSAFRWPISRPTCLAYCLGVATLLAEDLLLLLLEDDSGKLTPTAYLDVGIGGAVLV